jgi:hypothetical protein
MMGRKERGFAPLVNLSLDELVAPDHFYRYLVRTLDLSLVRDLVRTPRPQHLCKSGGEGALTACLNCYATEVIRRIRRLRLARGEPTA